MNGGSVHGDGHPFTLLIDLKSQGEPTYRAAQSVVRLQGYCHRRDRWQGERASDHGDRQRQSTRRGDRR